MRASLKLQHDAGADELTMKTYQVLIKAYATVIVEAANEDNAMELAEEQVSYGTFTFEESEVEKVLTDPNEIARAKAHAELVVEATF